MSHATSRYVKQLVKALNREKISVSEKAVLRELADDHREELGLARRFKR